jgi:hypothetical protein
MNTVATAITGHTYGHTGHIPMVCVAVVVAICATPATFVAVVAVVAKASVWDLRSSIFVDRGYGAGQFGGALPIETGRESRARCAVDRREPEVRSAGGEVVSAWIWGGEGRARKDPVESVQFLVAEQSQIYPVFHVDRLVGPAVTPIEEGHRG